MIKFTTFLAVVGIFLGMFLYASAQQNPVLTATLDASTPVATNLPENAQYYDVARITLTASGSDVYLNGMYVNADVPGGLSNLTNIYIYDATSGLTLLGTYPNQSENPNLVQFSNVTIGNGLSKTYLLRASITSEAAGNIRIGFSGFTYSTLAEPALNGVPIYGNVMTLPGIVVTPVPTPTPTPISTPMISVSPVPVINTPSSLGFSNLTAVSLREGDVVSSSGSGDPDVYIVNEWGYKRLFLNPVIFGFYGHLGGFSAVKNVELSTRNVLVPTGLYRNCETNDAKVYGLETTGEDTGILHWVNTSGEQAVADDPDFFKKVFCINTAEFSWYSQGSAYTSVSQVPTYSR